MFACLIGFLNPHAPWISAADRERWAWMRAATASGLKIPNDDEMEEGSGRGDQHRKPAVSGTAQTLSAGLTVLGLVLLLAGTHGAWGVALTVFGPLLLAWSLTTHGGPAWVTPTLVILVLGSGLVLNPVGNGLDRVLQGTLPPLGRMGNLLGAAGFLLPLLWVQRVEGGRETMLNPDWAERVASTEPPLRLGLLLALAIAALGLAGFWLR